MAFEVAVAHSATVMPISSRSCRTFKIVSVVDPEISGGGPCIRRKCRGSFRDVGSEVYVDAEAVEASNRVL